MSHIKSILPDILITSSLALGILYYVNRPDSNVIPDDLVNEKGENIDLTEPYLIHFWSSWSKPSQRDIQVLQRFNKKYPDIQIVGVSSEQEESSTLKDVKGEMGIYYPQATTKHFPQRIPLTVVVFNGQKWIINESLQYENLIDIFDKEI